MANLWDNLSDEDRMVIARHAMSGSEQSQGNLNRTLSQLAANPRLVERLAAEAGIGEGDGELEDAAPDSDLDQDTPNDIERTVNESLGEGDVQETGEVAADIPPPEQGESMQDYIARLMGMQEDDEEDPLANKRTRMKPLGTATNDY